MIKHLLCIFLLISSISQINAQNYVLNPGFEDTTACPTTLLNQVPLSSGLSSYRATPDFIHACAGNVPYSSLGMQLPHSGDAMCGFIIHDAILVNPNYREYIGSRLCEKLKVGDTYYASMYINRADNFSGSGDKVGIKFSTVAYNPTSPSFNNSAQIYTNVMINDTVNWVKISGTFVADSAYEYVIIGNFFDDGHCNYTPGTSYYLVDDICVSSDSGLCNTALCPDVGIHEQIRDNAYTISPNPFTESTDIQFNNPSKENCTLILYDLHGRIVQTIVNITSDKIKIERKELTSGLYFFKIYNNSGIIAGRLMIE